MLPSSHEEDSTKPIDADACAPKEPTIDASMKNISTLVTYANIEGILNPIIRLSFSAPVMDFPSRICVNNLSLLLLENIYYVNGAKLLF